MTFPNYHALRGELTWPHYRLLMKVESEKARQFYLEECVKSDWSRTPASTKANRITFNGEHFFVDLVFYNYILKCFVLIDLKTGKLAHQDLGQTVIHCQRITARFSL